MVRSAHAAVLGERLQLTRVQEGLVGQGDDYMLGTQCGLRPSPL